MKRILISLLLAAAASAAPKIKALIVDGQNNHAWQETTPVLKKLLEETGLFEVDVATTPPKGGDMSAFQPDFVALPGGGLELQRRAVVRRDAGRLREIRAPTAAASSPTMPPTTPSRSGPPITR